MSKHPSGQAGLEKTLPSAWYTREAVFALEREHIFFNEWLCAGREEQLPEAGDHRVLDLFGESILVVRNTEGKLRAHYNVCRHRGARLCPASESEQSDPRMAFKGGVVNHKVITCPYHAWTYDLDGQLIRAPHMPEDSGFKAQNVQLFPVGIACWGGFFFVHLSPLKAQNFDSVIGTAADALKRYPLAELRIGHSIEYAVDANWKILSENYNECYHCGPVHPELCQVVPAFREGGGGDLDWARGVPHREGATTFTSSGETTRRSFPALNEDEQTRHKGDLIYPNLWLSLSRDHVAAFILQPQAAGHTLVSCHFLFEPHEMAKKDFDPNDAVDFWHTVNQQDWAICERVQQGISARVHSHGVFSPMEDWNLDIRRYVSDRIGPHIEGAAEPFIAD